LQNIQETMFLAWLVDPHNQISWSEDTSYLSFLHWWSVS